MSIEWTLVESSNIAAIGSEVGNPDLHVQFKSGAEYIYSDVPQDVVQAFLAAESKGKYLNEYIKGVYEAEKVS